MPSAGPDTAIAGALGSIWSARRGDMAERAAVLTSAARAAASGVLTEVERAAAERAAHKLAGSLGMFGLDVGSELAREVEEALIAGDHLDELAELTAALELIVSTGPATGSLTTPAELRPSLLVVSGDPAFASRVAAEAAARGLRTAHATDPADGRRQLVTEGPGAILFDLDGLADSEAALDLIGDIDASALPVPVLVSGSVDALLERVQLATLGARGVFATGTEPGRLVDAVVRALDRRAGPAGALVLAVDDDPAVLAMLDHLLAPLGIELSALDDPLCFWERLEERTPDLVILDVDMPGVDGIELCRAMRNDAASGDIPVMFLTGLADADTVHRMFAAGADDYVSKPIVPLELTTRVGNRLERAGQARRLADTDGLTSLATRRKAEDVLARYHRLAARNGRPMSLAIVDVDHFKSVNDSLGHAAGDDVLRRLSRLLAAAFRGEDVVARWGGEEFVVGMYGTPSAPAVRRLREVLAAFRPGGITFSAGVATHPANGLDLEALHRAADAALYEAKASGRDRVVASGEKLLPAERSGNHQIVGSAARPAPQRRAQQAAGLRAPGARHSTR